MAGLTYNTTRNASTEYAAFELNYEYYPYVFYKENINFHFGSKVANELTNKLRNLMILYRDNL